MIPTKQQNNRPLETLFYSPKEDQTSLHRFTVPNEIAGKPWITKTAKRSELRQFISRRWRLPSGRIWHVAVIPMLPSVVIIPSSVLHQWMKQLPRASPIPHVHRQTKHSLAQHDAEQFDKKQDDSIEGTNEDEDAESQSINTNPKEPQTME